MPIRHALISTALLASLILPARAAPDAVDTSDPVAVLSAFLSGVDAGTFDEVGYFAGPSIALPRKPVFDPLKEAYAPLLAAKACFQQAGGKLPDMRLDGAYGLLVGRLCTLSLFGGEEEVEVWVELASPSGSTSRQLYPDDWKVENLYTIGASETSDDDSPVRAMYERRAARFSPAVAVVDYLKALKSGDYGAASKVSSEFHESDLAEIAQEGERSSAWRMLAHGEVLDCAEKFDGAVEVVRNPDDPLRAEATTCFGEAQNRRPILFLLRFEGHWVIEVTNRADG